MKKDRKAATKTLVDLIDRLIPGSPNTERYRKRLAELSDREFDAFMVKLQSGELVPDFIVPNLGKWRLNIERNFDIAADLGHNFFQRLEITDQVTGTLYVTPIEYLILKLFLRRQQQLLIKKSSIPDDNAHVDVLTAQPTGVSKSSRLSFPELNILNAKELESTIIELIKYRGGDTKGFNAMNRMIAQTGHASLDQLDKLGTAVKARETLSAFLKGIHLDNNL